MRVDTAVAREVGVPAHGLPVGGEPTNEPVEIVDEDTGMPFADRARVILDAEVDFDTASAKPRGAAAASTGSLPIWVMPYTPT